MNNYFRQYIFSTFNNEVLAIVNAYSPIFAAIRISKIIQQKNFTFTHTLSKNKFTATNDGAFIKIYRIS